MKPHRRDGRSARWDAHRQRRCAELLRSIREAVEQAEDPSMDFIAAKVGTSKTVLYRYFGDRAGLRRTMGEWALQHIEQSIRDVKPESPQDDLRHMIFAFVDFAARSPRVYRFCDVSDSAGSPLIDGIAQLIAERMGLESEKGSQWAHGAIGFINAAFLQWLQTQTSDSPDEFAAQLTDWLYPSAQTLPRRNMSRKDPLTLDTDALAALLDGKRAEDRRFGRDFAADDSLLLEDGMTLEEKREATLEALGKLIDTGIARYPLPNRFGGENRHDRHISVFEEVVTANPSLQVKAGVQIGLFAGAIQHLGNAEQHDAWLMDAVEGRLLGSFAMTEIGHGSDVAAVGTVAEYDPEADEFVITTPFRAAYKEYIGNAACHAHAAVVFARLIVDDVDHGVHAFVVPVRDEDGGPMPGVIIEDDGYKGGLPGVDNGRLAFGSVRIPRFNLLDRYGSVDEHGEYSSPIESPGRRFFTMIGTLVQGRVSLVGASNTAAKLAADIAVRYALDRRQFQSGDDSGEKTLLSYRRHQRRLMPMLARIWANQAAYDRLLDRFDDVFSGRDDSEDARAELETLAAGLKATTTWDSLDIIQEAREACGGAGYMAENRLVGLRADLDVYATFEGDNTVLLQLVGKRLLTDYAAEMKDIDFGGVARYLGSYTAEHTLYRSGIASVGSAIGDLFTPALNEKRIRSGRLQEALLASRADVTLAGLAENLRPAQKMSSAEAAELVNDHQNDLIETARAFIDLHKWRALNDLMHTVDADESPAEAKFLHRLRDLYGLELIQAHAGWHIAHGRLSMARARQIDPAINRLVAKLAANAEDAVVAFGYGPEHRRCPIADGEEQQRQQEARDYYRKLRRAGQMPRDEKEIYRRRLKRRAQLKEKSPDA